ncbi:M61 family metallopeptidase [Roseivirga thermotolerans]|uniref:Peptidase M61 n=1 Tax=Roseivirga thermotolerans TaxID=1758176 RepID=A0ABQ3IDT1_9BACT|nr:M61 family metallopeptidase [Roseivirga thermotolerans]GHE76199.1 peptidase M61 [Roseivirga thermotolerans]
MLKFQISYKNPLTHILKLKLEIDKIYGDQVNLKLPVWRPGRYEIQNFPKRIRGFKVADNRGKQLSFKKTAKDTWTIDIQERTSLTVEYEYFAGLLDGGNTWLDDEQLYVNPINCCMYEASSMNEEIEIELDLPQDYTIASGLKPNGNHKLTAKSYYQLVDSPIFASASLRTVGYTVGGHEFFIHIQGDVPQTDEELIADFKPFTEKQMEVMGGFPCRHYHFLIQSLPYKAYHGVEHWNSTVICLGPSQDLGKRELYKELLGVSSHELFHTWNVIRLRPKEMVPYNFSGENYHETGFVTEGITTYYGDLFLVRSGVFSVEEYMTELNKLLKRHYENEGRKSYSVAQSSFDLWLDGYERGVPGRKVSIYNEGALAALILDLSIRQKFNNARSLDDVIRLLWQRHSKDMSGYTLADYQLAAESVYEGSLETYFEQIILGTHPYEHYLAPLLEWVGLDFKKKDAEKVEERLFGFRLLENRVDMIAENSPAELGLCLNDLVVSINGKKPTEAIEACNLLNLEVQRMGVTKNVTLRSTNSQYFQVYEVQPKANMNEHDQHLLCGWLELK